jgi:hypothetical protein
MTAFTLLVVMSAGLLWMARWGRSNAERLVSPAWQGKDRQDRTTVLRRGATSCYGVSAILLVAAIASRV